MLLFRMKQPPQKEAIPLIKHIAKQIKFCAVIKACVFVPFKRTLNVHRP